MDQKKTIRPFSMKDKIGYTLGDLGCCFTEQYRAMYLSIFYTLILQVNPFHVGILLLITKIWDAVNDPIIGALVDSRKATKGGKFIPWTPARPPRAASSSRGFAPSPSPWQCCAYLALSM